MGFHFYTSWAILVEEGSYFCDIYKMRYLAFWRSMLYVRATCQNIHKLVIVNMAAVQSLQKKKKTEQKTTRSGNRSGHSRLCDFKWPQIDIWPHNIGRASQADQHVWVLWPCYVTWTSYSIFWWKWTFDPSDPKWPQNDIWPHNIGRGSQDDEHV